MKIERNKIVFGSIILVIVLFILGYAMMVMDNGDAAEKSLEQTEVPKLEEQQSEYRSKLEAVDNIPEERIKNIPSVYDERLLDSTGLYDPDFMDRDKQRIVDSIYSQGRIDYSQGRYRNEETKKVKTVEPVAEDTIQIEVKESHITKELALEHQLFFAADPKSQSISFAPDPHVVLVGLEVIYVENSIRGEVANEVVDDVLDDINIAGVPQVSGIKKVFQRGHRRTKVAVLNNYKLILKTPEGQ